MHDLVKKSSHKLPFNFKKIAINLYEFGILNNKWHLLK